VYGASNESDADDVDVRGNTRAIESIIANIVDNAVRTKPIGGGVLVRAKADAVVEVVDQGQIPERLTAIERRSRSLGSHHPSAPRADG